jgi:hypothetical protein
MLNPCLRMQSYTMEKAPNGISGISNDANYYVARQEAIGHVVCQKAFPRN